APFRSMVQHIHRHSIPHPPIHLIFGTRTQNDLLYVEELKQLEQKMEGFHFFPTLSREKWNGRQGYVHDVYEDLVKSKHGDSDLPPAQFYLCGWKAMVDEAKQRIQGLGYERKAIHQELYG
ncbi:MAG: FAD-dependent oxidoreductase, partial [Chitinophagaceae bacterium]